MNNIGKMIRTRRIQLGITQEELANKMGYKSKSTINKIEKGINDIPRSKIVEFANALNTTPMFLMGWSNDAEEVVNQTAKEIGERLQLLEDQHGYKEEFVSSQLGVSLEQYKKMKKGVNRVFDTNLLLKASYFYNLRWDDFFGRSIPVPDISDNLVALQKMSGKTIEEITDAIGISIQEYNQILNKEIQLDFNMIEKFNNFYNLSFSVLVGTDFSIYEDNPEQCLSVKMQSYLHDIFIALNGETFQKDDMDELISYIHFLAMRKKEKRNSKK